MSSACRGHHQLSAGALFSVRSRKAMVVSGVELKSGWPKVRARRGIQCRGWLRRESSGSRLSRGLVAWRRVVTDALSFWKRMWKLRVESSVIPN